MILCLFTLKELKKIVSGTNAESFIALDGAVSMETIDPMIKAGINHFVGGTSSIYKNINRNDDWTKQSKIIKKNWVKIKELTCKEA